tara:strand:- start:500 stop:739 length:240 start_codon:yes stop_codon:yes gene_type:complete
MNNEQRIAELEAQLASLQKQQNRSIELKVSQKGCVQINGIRRFPFTFYKDEIKQILSMSETIYKFIDENENKLSTKEKN